MSTIELKKHPEVKAIILAAFPHYRKTKAYVSVFSEEHGHSINSYWDSGSRDEYAIVELATKRQSLLPTASHPHFDVANRGLANKESDAIAVDGRGNATLKILPEGFCLVQAGTDCGKPATAHLFLNQANLAKLLPEAVNRG